MRLTGFRWCFHSDIPDFNLTGYCCQIGSLIFSGEFGITDGKVRLIQNDSPINFNLARSRSILSSKVAASRGESATSRRLV